ncbi:hypothetical protein OY671_010952, partial [Metschnikowia pulcherrima]
EISTSASGRIADFWNFSNTKSATVLGVSAATVSRSRSGRSVLDQASKSYEAGQFSSRLFRSLDASLGSDDAAARRWSETANLDLNARSLDSIDSFRGSISVCDYVDAYRARV